MSEKRIRRAIAERAAGGPDGEAEGWAHSMLSAASSWAPSQDQR